MSAERGEINRGEDTCVHGNFLGNCSACVEKGQTDTVETAGLPKDQPESVESVDRKRESRLLMGKLTELSAALEAQLKVERKLLASYDTPIKMYIDGKELLEERAGICAENVTRLNDKLNAVLEARKSFRGAADKDDVREKLEERETELEVKGTELVEEKEELEEVLRKKKKHLISVQGQSRADLEEQKAEIRATGEAIDDIEGKLALIEKKLVRNKNSLHAARGARQVVDGVGVDTDVSALVGSMVKKLPDWPETGGAVVDQDFRDRFNRARQVEQIWTRDLPAAEAELRAAQTSGDNEAVSSARSRIDGLNSEAENLRKNL